MPATHAWPAPAGHSAFELHFLPLATGLGVSELGPPASDAEVWQSSRRHSLLLQPLKSMPPKLLSKPSTAKRATTLAMLGVETTPETIRESVELLTGRFTGLPCNCTRFLYRWPA